MKFEDYSFWKHENGKDAFLCVHHAIQDDGKTAVLTAEWLAQGVDHYWTCPIPEQEDGRINPTVVTITVTPEHYDKWKPYAPRGKYLGPGDKPKYPKDPDLSL